MPKPLTGLVMTAVALVAAVILSACQSGTPVSTETSQVHIVVIEQFKFIPETVEVRPGDRIVWINRDIVPHTATAKDKSWDTGLIQGGERREIRVTPEMFLEYYCDYHPVMTARLAIN
ncbi:MAG: plastocyanin/azurin family copper-binding protein [Pseudomonadota bacterium]